MGVLDMFKKRVDAPLVEAWYGIEPTMNEEDFCRAMIHNILGRIIDDALNPIELEGGKDNSLIQSCRKFFNIDNVISEDNIFRLSVSLKDIIIFSIYRPLKVCKVFIENEYFYFIDHYISNKKIRVGNNDFPVESAVSICRPLIDKNTLFYPFRLLYSFYRLIDLYAKKGNVLFFKKANFNKVLDGSSPEMFDQFVEQAKEVYKKFLAGKGGIVDSQDSFEFLTPEISGITEALNFAYTELSRLLGIPQAELLGETPTGLNSGGVIQFQSVTYEKRLKDYRKRLIEPILKEMDVPYVVSGLSIEEKLAVLQDFGVNAINIQATDEQMYGLYKQYILEVMNVSEEDLPPINRSEQASKNPTDDLPAVREDTQNTPTVGQNRA